MKCCGKFFNILILFAVGLISVPGIASSRAPSIEVYKAYEAELGLEVLSYEQWKAQQVLDAQNRATRLANQLILLKNSKSLKAIEVTRAEADLRNAMQNSEVVRDLSLEDYFTVYLAQYADKPRALEKAATSLNPAQVAELLQLLLKSKSPSYSLESSSRQFLKN